MKVLLVDDDPDLVDITTYALRRDGFNVLTAADGQQALRRVEAERPDLVLLDINLPSLNGFEVCRQIRRDHDTAIIMLTALLDDDAIVRALDLGADDYVVKPFSPKQLLARMRAVLRRGRADALSQPRREVRAGDLHLDLQAHLATKAGVAVRLTPLEFRLLHLLAMNPGRVVPYARLVEYAWGYDEGDPSLLKTHIYHLRRKLGLAPKQADGIRAIPGLGYSLGRG